MVARSGASRAYAAQEVVRKKRSIQLIRISANIFMSRLPIRGLSEAPMKKSYTRLPLMRYCAPVRHAMTKLRGE